jgi:hypothetical protein
VTGHARRRATRAMSDVEPDRHHDSVGARPDGRCRDPNG